LKPDLKEALANNLKKGMLEFMATYPDEFQHLLELALSKDKEYAWRAAWLLTKCMKKNDPRVAAYIDTMINQLDEVPDGLKRELMNVLLLVEMDEDQLGELYNKCVQAWEKTTSIPSVRVRAFQLMFKIAASYPELYHEIRLLTEEHYLASLSPGIRNTVVKLLQSIQEE